MRGQSQAQKETPVDIHRCAKHGMCSFPVLLYQTRLCKKLYFERLAINSSGMAHTRSDLQIWGLYGHSVDELSAGQGMVQSTEKGEAMDLLNAIQEEKERRKADKQYWALNRSFVKNSLRVIPGGKRVNQKPDK